MRLGALIAVALFAVWPAAAQQPGSWADSIVSTQTVPLLAVSPSIIVPLVIPNGPLTGTAAGMPIGNFFSDVPTINFLNPGVSVTIDDVARTTVGGYHEIGFGFDGTGNYLLSFNSQGGASAKTVKVNVNGTSYDFPGAGGGNAVMPTSPAITAGHIVIANGGTTIADSGLALSNGGILGNVTVPTGALAVNCGNAGTPIGRWSANNCFNVTTPVGTVPPVAWGSVALSAYANIQSNPGGQAAMFWADTAGYSASGSTSGVESSAVAGTTGQILYGLNGYCDIYHTGYRGCQGGEIDIEVFQPVDLKVGWNIVDFTDTTQGTLVDAALAIDSSGVGSSHAPGWKIPILIGGFNETNNTPISAGGIVLETYTGIATALQDGIDISGLTTINGHTGAGFTYTGNFFKADANNHWSGAGVFVATGSGNSHNFVRTDGGAVVVFETTTGNAIIAVNTRTTATQTSEIDYRDNGVAKWKNGKDSDNSWFQFDVATGVNYLSVGEASVPGQVVIGEGSGKYVKINGIFDMTNISGAGTATQYVCADATNKLVVQAGAC